MKTTKEGPNCAHSKLGLLPQLSSTLCWAHDQGGGLLNLGYWGHGLGRYCHSSKIVDQKGAKYSRLEFCGSFLFRLL